MKTNLQVKITKKRENISNTIIDAYKSKIVQQLRLKKDKIRKMSDNIVQTLEMDQRTISTITFE